MDDHLLGSLSIEFPRQEYCSGLPFPSPVGLSDRGMEPASSELQAVSCIAGRFFTDCATEEAPNLVINGCSSVANVVSDSLWPHGLQLARLPCPSPSPRVCSNSCPSSPWCHPTISSSVVPFSFCPQSFPASGSLPMSQLFTSGGQSIGTSVSVLPMNIQSWFPLGLTDLTSST